jgi:hypothetical protein
MYNFFMLQEVSKDRPLLSTAGFMSAKEAGS